MNDTMKDAVRGKLKAVAVLWFVGAGIQVLLSIISVVVSLANIDSFGFSAEQTVYGSLSPFWTIALFVPGAIFMPKVVRMRGWARIVMGAMGCLLLLMGVKAIWEFWGLMEYDVVLFSLGMTYGAIGVGLGILMPVTLLLSKKVRLAFKG